ncbi:MAG: helix-turn-helix domain-containing protein [Calditrichaeota bacterium]|nr:helix-turn-helix domain-containing protein [Calditrichota bacterium]
MSDLERYIEQRKQRDETFAANFEKGCADFKIGILIRQAREKAGLTQEQLAQRVHTKKTAISRIENHARDIRLSTLEKVANALGMELHVVLK